MSRMMRSLFFTFSTLIFVPICQFVLAATVSLPKCLLIKIDGELSCWGSENIRGVTSGQTLTLEGVRPKTENGTTFLLTQSAGSRSTTMRELRAGENFSLPESGSKFQLKVQIGGKTTLEVPVVKVTPKLQYIVVKSGESKLIVRPGEIADIQEVMPFEILEIKATVSDGLKVKTSAVTPMLDKFNVLYKGRSIGWVYFAKKVKI